jgi:hypothetical protein
MADWSRHFDEPIALPDGGELRTLQDAGRYVDKLPRSMHEREEWKMVMEVLLLAVEGCEPVSLLRIALTLAVQEKRPDERATALTRAGAVIVLLFPLHHKLKRDQ